MTEEELAAIRERDAMTVNPDRPLPLTISERDRRLLLAEVDRLRKLVSDNEANARFWGKRR